MANDADDLERYRRDLMTPAERHAFEKKAMDDPFLRDALSGAETVSPESFKKDINNLNHRLAPTATWFTPIRIAAGILLLVSVGWLLFRTAPVAPESLADLKKDSTDLGDSTTKLLTLASPQKDSAESLDKKDPVKSIAAIKPTEPSQVATQPAPSSTAGQSASGAAAKVEPIKSDVAKTELTHAEDAKRETAKSVVAEEARRDEQVPVTVAPSAFQKRSAAAQPQVVTGTVREAQQGLPLAGVSVTEKESKQKAETGPDGRYTIPVTTEQPTLSYSYDGLKTVERKANVSRAVADVKLDDDATQKSEVLVFPSDSSATNAPIELAAPVGGLEAYSTYLGENQRMPDAARTSRIHGRVTVSFEVSATGSMSGLRVLKSLGFGCDEELMRLIRGGPAWSPTLRNGKPQASTVWVKLEFVADR